MFVSSDRWLRFFKEDKENATRKQERAKSIRSASSLDIAHKVGADELAERYQELKTYVRGLQGTLQRERDATKEVIESLRADNKYYVDQFTKINLEHQKALSEIQKIRLHQPIPISQDHSSDLDDDWNSGNFYEGSALFLISNVVHKVKPTIIFGTSDSFLVSKVQAGGTSGRMNTGEASPSLVAAGDYTKINFRNLLAHLVEKYKDERNFSAKDKKDFEAVAIWHTEEALKNMEIPGQLKRTILLYYESFKMTSIFFMTGCRKRSINKHRYLVG